MAKKRSKLVGERKLRVLFLSESLMPQIDREKGYMITENSVFLVRGKDFSEAERRKIATEFNAKRLPEDKIETSEIITRIDAAMDTGVSVSIKVAITVEMKPMVVIGKHNQEYADKRLTFRNEKERRAYLMKWSMVRIRGLFDRDLISEADFLWLKKQKTHPKKEDKGK